MNTKKKALRILLSLILVIGIMLVGAVFAGAYDYDEDEDEDGDGIVVVDRIVAEGDWEPVRGQLPLDNRYFYFDVTERDEYTIRYNAYYYDNDKSYWEKYNEATGEWEEHGNTYFGCGTYRLRHVKVFVPNGLYWYRYDLAEDVKIIINGEEWTIDYREDGEDYYSVTDAYITSPAVSLCYGGTATCKDKAECTVCGEGYGSLAAHKGGTATCKAKAKCTVCGVSYGSLAAHKGGTATCKAKAKCSVCGVSYGNLNSNNHKNIKTLNAVSATCGKAGKTAGKQCADCSKVTVAQKSVAATGKHTGGTATCKAKAKCKVCGLSYGSLAAHKGGKATCKAKAKCSVCGASYGSLKAHTNKDVTTKATLKKNGKIENKCTVCGKVSKKTTIYMPKTIKLSDTSFTYNGKAKKPTVTVKDSKGKKLKKDTDYTVKYSKGRKSIGSYTATVTFKGKYSGKKKLTFKIVLGKPTLSKLTAGKKQITPAWKVVSGASGYEVQYSTSEKFTKKTTKKITIKKGKTKKTTIKKLKEATTYYVRVRAYKTVNKKKVYSSYSAVKSVKIKKTLTAREKEVAKALNECRRYCAYLYYDAKILKIDIDLYRMTGRTSYYIDIVDGVADCANYMTKICNIADDYRELFMLETVADFDEYPYVSPNTLAYAASFATKGERVASIYNIMCDDYNLEPIDMSE